LEEPEDGKKHEKSEHKEHNTPISVEIAIKELRINVRGKKRERHDPDSIFCDHRENPEEKKSGLSPESAQNKMSHEQRQDEQGHA
jgi:hypothetical protein